MELFEETQGKEIPDDARVWVFPSSKEIAKSDLATLESELNSFISAWHAHKVSVRGGYAIINNRFIVVAADEAACMVSGCSTDSLFRAISDIFNKLGCSLGDLSDVLWKDNTNVRSANRENFQKLINEKVITADTIVFDTTVSTVNAFKTNFETPLKNSWHGKYFNGI